MIVSRAIELDTVSVTFGARTILRDLVLRVEPGQRVALVGRSGSGKTTVLRLVAGFLAPDFGVVRIGQQVVARDGRSVVPPEARGVGMVFQDLALWPHLTVRGNLGFGLQARRIGRAERDRRIDEMLELVGLHQLAGAMPTRLSGGEQQRVALARALVLRPAILLMDEPLASLDEALNQRLRREIVRLHAELGFTLLYVTHREDEAAAIAERVVSLEKALTLTSRNVPDTLR